MLSLIIDKVNKAFDLPIVGDFVFSDHELASIYDNTSNILRWYANEHGGQIQHTNDKLIFIALVNASKQWDADEDTFWGFISRKFTGSDSSTLSQKVYNYITDLIFRLGADKKVYVLGCYKKKYYATLISHAFAPLKSTESFFELCWEIYCDDLYQNYMKGDSVFSVLSAQLKSRFRNQNEADEDFHLGSQVYSLRAGIKGLAIDQPELMTDLIENTISSIDKAFHGEILDKDNHYLDRLVINWWKKKEDSLGLITTEKNVVRERVVTDYQLIKPKYIIADNSVRLVLSPFRLQSDFDVSPCLTIFEHGEAVKTFELYTKGSGLLMATKPFSVEIDSLQRPSMDISVEITHANKTLYSSKNSLKRSFILFKSDKEDFSQQCTPGNYSLYAPCLDSLAQYPEEIRRQSGNLYVFTSQEGECLQSDERTVFFETSNTPKDFWIFANKRQDVAFRQNENEYEVADGDVFIASGPEVNAEEYGVRYEGASFRLSELPYERRADGCFYKISELMRHGEPQTISVFKYSNNEIKTSLNIVSFKNIKVDYDKRVYYDSSEIGEVHFSTDNFDNSETFDLSYEEVLVPIGEGEIVLNPPIFAWKFDSGDYSTRYNDGIWYNEISNSSVLSVKLPINCTGQLLISDEKSVANTDNTSYKLGQAIHAMADGQKKPAEIMYRLIFPDNSSANLLVCRFYFSEFFRFPPLFILAQEKLVWNPRGGFIGPSYAKFMIHIYSSTHSVSITTTLEPKTYQLVELDEGNYTLEVSIIGQTGLTKAKVLETKSIIKGDERNFKFKKTKLKIDSVILDGSSNSKPVTPFFIDKLHYLKTVDGNDFYSGKLYIITARSGKVYLDNMADDNGNTDKTNPIRIEMRDENSCWIMFGLEDEDDLYSVSDQFAFDKVKKQICNSDRNSSAITYYNFTTIKEGC